MTQPGPGKQLRICVVGSGTRFISGISYYTYLLADALSDRFDVSTILMRRLVPRLLYPGRRRVGSPISDMHRGSAVPTFDGIDWFLIPSLVRARRFLRTQEPDVVVLQWWTGAVLPAYLFLSREARRMGAVVILEFHEDQDTGEAGLPLIARIISPLLLRLVRHSVRYVVHSEFDRTRLSAKFDLRPESVTVIGHGPYPMASQPWNLHGQHDPIAEEDRSLREEPPEAHFQNASRGSKVTILFFGVIRPYKGLEDLIDAFSLLPRDDETQWQLLVVGETWEGWHLPTEKINASPFREDIEFVNRYVLDSELPGIFDRVDLVALPYLRSSASGPLHLTMSRGLPVVVTDVGGLTEAARSYSGTVFARPNDPESLASGILEARLKSGVPHRDSQSWESTVSKYDAMCTELLITPLGSGRREALAVDPDW